MPFASYKKKYTNKITGEVKTYDYSKDTSLYSIKSYNKKKELHPKIVCEICERMVYEFYMSKHLTRKTCRPKHRDTIEEPKLTNNEE